MFTGIIEALGEVISLRKEGSNLRITLRTPFASELKEGQSVAHNGVCLTVEKIEASKKTYTITAVKETLAKTNFRKIKAGDKINLERSLKVGDRLDGHFVQGHVDTTAKVKSIKKEKGSWLFSFEVKSQKQAVSEAELSKVKSLILEKGSICVNGVSLTVVAVQPKTEHLKQETAFSAAIIPHTYKNTVFSCLKKGDLVNLEFDILAKHIQEVISKSISIK